MNLVPVAYGDLFPLLAFSSDTLYTIRKSCSRGAMTQKNNAEVTLKNIQKIYHMGEVEVPVLTGINLEIVSGKLTVLLGASGSGKSTLLNLIGGIDTPTAGEVWHGEHNIASFSDRQLTEFRRKRIGFVFQFYNLVATLTAKENVEICTDIADNPMKPEDALAQVGLGDRINHFPAELSGGQQQRVAIARALSKNPLLMLCDEPTGALDHNTSVVVLNLLQKLNHDLGTTIVMITHAPPIADMADHVIRIGSGVVQETYENKQPKTAEEIEL